MPAFASKQEEIIFSFSQAAFGKPTLFLPELYGHSKQPADIVWLANRCAILMYLTESKKSCEKKIEHNIRQLTRWLGKWRKGEFLTWTAEDKTHQVAYDDIDHILALSIVDGGETWCQYHPELVSSLASLKVSACATITTPVLSELARAGCTPVDIVHWVDALRAQDARMSSEDLCKSIREVTTHTAQMMLQQFDQSTHPPKKRDSVEIQTHCFMQWAKQHANIELRSIGSDITRTDAIWCALSSAVVKTNLAEPGANGPILNHMSMASGPYTFRCVAAVNSSILKDQFSDFLIQGPGVSFFFMLDIGPEAPLGFVVSKHLVDQPSRLEIELVSLRDATLNPTTTVPVI